MSLVAVAVNGSPVEPTLGIAVAPGDTITVEIRLSDWTADLPQGKLRVFEANLDMLGASQSGATGTVLPLNWRAPLVPASCASAANCPAQFPVCDTVCKRCVAVGHDFLGGMTTDCDADGHPFAGLPFICDVGGACTLIARKHFGVLEDEGVVHPGGNLDSKLGEFALSISLDAIGTFVFDLAGFPNSFIAGPDVQPVAVPSHPLTICTTPVSVDCNNNLVPDECDVAAGKSLDKNANAAPDECDLDLDGDQDLDLRDAAVMLNCFGAANPACLAADFFLGDGIGLADWAAMAANLTGQSSTN